MKTVWITWEQQRRNKPIADELDAEFFQLDDTLKLSRIKRYIVNISRTFNIFRKTRPSVVIAQNPSVVLALTSVILSKVFQYKVGLDTHNFGFGLKSDTKSKFMHIVAPWLQRNADFIIAHNEGLKKQIEHRGGNIVVLPDKIPTIIKPNELKKLDGKMNFLFISSFATDEPWKEVIQAFKELSPEYHVYITGNYKKVVVDPSDYPSNIHFIGRIPWDEYDQMLYSVDGVIDLTTRENCLLCGAYEAVACERPMILSNTVALRSYFYKGAVYADNTASSIKQSVLDMIDNYHGLQDVKLLKIELEDNWRIRVEKLKQIISINS